MENKCLVCGAIIHEGRQVCTNCEKGGKHEISKKLTDEQIELETYLNSFEEGDNITVTCDLLNAMEQALDLIHRLQEHNGNEVRMRCDMQRKFDDLQNLCIEQKDEIEELKEMCSKSSYKDSWKNKFFKAQEEIERLTKLAELRLRDNQDTCNLLVEKEKQVDELKEKLWKSKQDMMTYHSKTVDEAVKDTAKEILDDLRNTFIEQSSYGCDANQHIGYYDYVVKIGLVIEQVEEYAKLKYGIEYGVEVE